MATGLVQWRCGVEHMLVSARTGEALEESRGWMRSAGSDPAPASVGRVAVASR